jgi:hypothetical protein
MNSCPPYKSQGTLVEVTWLDAHGGYDKWAEFNPPASMGPAVAFAGHLGHPARCFHRATPRRCRGRATWKRRGRSRPLKVTPT